MTETAGPPVLTTHLYALESESVRLESFDGSGGAIESIGEDLLVVTPKGRFALVFPDTVEYLDGLVPMNYTGLQSSPISEHLVFDLYPFRVADILLKEIEEGYILFATLFHRRMCPVQVVIHDAGSGRTEVDSPAGLENGIRCGAMFGTT